MSDNNNWIKCCTKVKSVPRRVLLVFWCFSAVAISFAIRLVITFATIEMIMLPKNFTKLPKYDYCRIYSCDYNSEVYGHEKQFDWSEMQVGILFASFFIGYFIVQIPSGVLLDISSGKVVWSLGMILASIFTCFLSMATEIEQDFLYLLVMRLFIGLFSGPLLNSMNSIISKWFPENEIWLAGGIIYSGVPFGGLLSSLCSGLVLHQENKWSTLFNLFGAVGILLNIIFFLFIYGMPEKHPSLLPSEKEFLETNVRRPDIHYSEIPWRAILSNPAVIGLVSIRAGQDFGFNIMLMYFPKYFSDILCSNLTETAIFSALLFLCACIFSILSALLAQTLFKRDILPTTIRKSFGGFSSIFAATFLVAGSFCGCDDLEVMLTFCIAMFGMGFYLTGLYTNEVAISRTFSGTISGIVNTASCLTAFIGPLLVGFLSDSRSVTEWRGIIWIIFIIFNASTIAYMVWGSGTDQGFEALVPTLTPEEIEKRITERHTREKRYIFALL